ncbi:MAG: hypothetical protein ACM3X1_01230 [Ignavibacteriales bacterium]
MEPNSTAILTVTWLAAAIAMGGGLSLLSANNVIAQMPGNMTDGTMRPNGMMGMGPGMMGMGPAMMGNQSAMMQMIGAGQNITGSINLFSTISNAIESKVKTSLSEAASTAEGAVGNNSHAVVAHIGKTNVYLTYCVLVLGPDMRINMVIVDPGNGQVLSNSQIPLQPPMMGMGSGTMDHGMGMMVPGMMGMSSGTMDHGMGMMGPGIMGMSSCTMDLGMGIVGHGIMW